LRSLSARRKAICSTASFNIEESDDKPKNEYQKSIILGEIKKVLSIKSCKKAYSSNFGDINELEEAQMNTVERIDEGEELW
jgi:hypothetical protein